MEQRDIEPEEMPPQYDPAAAESRWYPMWLERGYFHADETSDRPPFCIVIPPPNVTGALHVGHALGRTIEDTLVRRARMQGFETLWVPGTDHAGIATQVVVERQLEEEGIDRQELGREAFIERVWTWKERYGGRIVEQLKRLGVSCDWERLRFTMDEGLSRAVRVAFVRMYEDGLIYRGERLVNWCPKDGTGISDSEVQYEDVEGELVTFRYPLSDGSGGVEVATTRVETMLGDTGVAVHPGDERYRALVGRTVRHPFDGRDIPIVADAAVDPEFGTGVVKVTPAHDPNDFDIATRTGLPLMNILDADARLSDAAPEEFRGLDRYEARARVRERLDELGLLVNVERPYIHAVGHCYRCHSEIEPWIAGKQWFVAVDRLKEPAKEVVEAGRVRFAPDRWVKPYLAWLDNLRDWNISRQLWWGHRIPVWYCPNGHEFAAVEDPATCPECGSAEIEQDPDVLDTWFSSQLWPFSTLGWPEPTKDLEKFYPTTVLVTAYDILYLWVARMIMSAMYLVGGPPFENVVIHGLVRDVQGRKMGKSLGNVIDPLDMVERYGADALRFSLARLATGGQQDISLSEDAIEGGQHFANKIWNAGRLVLRAYPGGTPELPPRERWTLTERWIISRHDACLEELDTCLEEFRFSDAAQSLQRFVWSEFCDWALELEKARLTGNDAQRSDAANVLAWVFERTLRMLHPTMPFVTEEIWQRFAVGESIAIAPWPEPQEGLRDAVAEEEFEFLQEVVSEIRRLQTSAPGSLRGSIELDRSWGARIEPHIEDVGRVTGAQIELADLDGAKARLRIPAGADVGSLVEAKRKKLREARAKLERKRAKLDNEGFVSKAPPEIVDGERADVARLGDDERRLLAELLQLGGSDDD
ncbi:MAG: valine--tRNA ligase [Actinomycetota bacterium]|nr:valine--tRNA ligase [Actinomycetota bacterium]